MCDSNCKKCTYNFETYSKPQSILLGLTDDCNMKCPYCFVQQQKNFMSLDVAIQAIEWLLFNGNNNEKLHIGFFGGEPLLQYKTIIKPIVERYGDISSFVITTNGILLDEDKIDFFYQNNIPPLLSFDGVREVQNFQRPLKNGDSFDKILNNIPYLLLRFPNTTMRATLTKFSIPYMYKSILMAEELGFNNITFCENAYESWEEKDFKELEYQLDKICLHIYKKLMSNEECIKINPIINIFNKIDDYEFGNIEKNTSLLRCGLGTTSCGITYNGLIVPCQEKLSNPYNAIGDVFTGIDPEKHKQFLEDYYNKINNLNCNKLCDDKTRSICMSNNCPSRMEDLNFNISSASCLFIKALVRKVGNLYYLCNHSINPLIRKYFTLEDN